MPVVFGENAFSLEDIITAFRRHGDAVRGTYRAHYRFDAGMHDIYKGTRLERPESLRDNPPDVVYPWEQVFLAAAACAGSDYPMFAPVFGINLERIDLVIEGVFDPRGEFDGILDFRAPASAKHCYLSLNLCATAVSSGPRSEIEKLHDFVLSHNMVLGALRGIPMTNELVVMAASAESLSLAP